jgi:type IV secretion system protein VirB10
MDNNKQNNKIHNNSGNSASSVGGKSSVKNNNKPDSSGKNQSNSPNNNSSAKNSSAKFNQKSSNAGGQDKISNKLNQGQSSAVGKNSSGSSSVPPFNNMSGGNADAGGAGGNDSGGGNGGGGSNGDTPAVANQGDSRIIFAFVAIVIGFVLFLLFSGGGDDEPQVVRNNNSGRGAETAGRLPNAEIARPPVIPEPPPPPPVFSAPTPPVERANRSIAPRPPTPMDVAPSVSIQEKLKASMVAFGGGGLTNVSDPSYLGLSGNVASANGRAGSSSIVGLGGGNNINDMADGSLGLSAASNVRVTKVDNPYNTIFQGKMLDATLETSINTSLPGVLRAVVSRNVYAEAGKRVLIPKGSRLIGTYNTEVRRGQGRVYIIWNRVIRPDGTDIALSSPSVGGLGESGLKADVDSKYLELFSEAIFLSLLNIGFAKLADSVAGNGNVEQTQNENGSTTNSGDVGGYGALEAVRDFGSVVTGVAGNLADKSAVAYIDQGAALKIFVNRDVKFPPTSGFVRFVR